MGGRWIGANDYGDIGMFDRVEILRARRGAESRRKTIAGRRVADSGTSIHVVVAEAGADQFLYQIGLFISAARRRDATDRIAAVLILNTFQSSSGKGKRLVP